MRKQHTTSSIEACYDNNNVKEIRFSEIRRAARKISPQPAAMALALLQNVFFCCGRVKDDRQDLAYDESSHLIPPTIEPPVI